MDLMAFANPVAVVASILGAVVSVWQARRAYTAASDVSNLRAQLKTYRQATEITEMQGLCTKAIQDMKKYGTTRGSIGLTGASPEKDIQSVQDVLLCLRKHLSIFKKWKYDELGEIVNNISELLEKFSSCNDEEIKSIGKTILNFLGDLSGFLKEFLDEREENIN